MIGGEGGVVVDIAFLELETGYVQLIFGLGLFETNVCMYTMNDPENW